MRARADCPTPIAWSIVLIALGAAGATALGLLLGVRWVLPLLGAVVAYPFFAANLACGRPQRAILLMIWWALALSLAATVASMALPDRAALVVWRGPEYADEMMEWVRTGAGPEGTPSLFLPQHVIHFLLFSAACLATAGLAGLYVGAALLNYMNFYVATLTMEAARPTLAAALAWPPWAILRVLGFVIVSVPLSAVLMSRLSRWRFAPGDRYWKYYVWGIALVILDAALKAVLAPYWRQLLLRAL